MCIRDSLSHRIEIARATLPILKRSEFHESIQRVRSGEERPITEKSAGGCASTAGSRPAGLALSQCSVWESIEYMEETSHVSLEAVSHGESDLGYDIEHSQ